MQIKCTKCGFENPMGAIFCRGCGEKIDMAKLDPETLAAQKKECDKATGGGSGKTIRNIIGIVLLLLIAAVAAAMVVPMGHPAYTAPAEDQDAEKALLQKWENIADEHVMRKLPATSFTTAELDRLFDKRILADVGASSGTYAIEHIQFQADGDQLKAILYTKISGKVPVIFTLSGKPGIADKALTFEVASAKMGHIPMIGSFLSKIVSDKYLPAVNTSAELKRVLERASGFTVADGTLTVRFDAAPKADAAPEAAVEKAEAAPASETKVVKKKKKSSKKKRIKKSAEPGE